MRIRQAGQRTLRKKARRSGRRIMHWRASPKFGNGPRADSAAYPSPALGRGSAEPPGPPRRPRGPRAHFGTRKRGAREFFAEEFRLIILHSEHAEYQGGRDEEQVAASRGGPARAAMLRCHGDGPHPPPPRARPAPRPRDPRRE